MTLICSCSKRALGGFARSVCVLDGVVSEKYMFEPDEEQECEANDVWALR